MKKALLFFLSLLIVSICCQGGNPTRQFRLGEDKSFYDGAYSPASNGRTTITMGLRRDSFLNGTFFSGIQDGTIKPGLGWTVSYSYYVMSHLEIEGAMFYSSYHMNTSKIASEKAMHQGLEFFGNLYVLPPLGEWTRIFCPYVGAGYSSSSIQAEEMKVSTATGGFVAKGGVRLYLSNGLNVRAEYKQSLPVSSIKLFRGIEIGISLTM